MSNDLVPPTPTISEASFNEDWDRSLILQNPNTSGSKSPQANAGDASRSQNSVVFPADEDTNAKPQLRGPMRRNDKRTLSELLKLHAEKGTDVNFSQEEALRVADVLGQWINASSSPYEAEDDFFARSQDDTALLGKSSSLPHDVRTRGQSESIHRS